MKVINQFLLAAMLLLITLNIKAQTPYYSPERMFDTTICDQNGKRYTLSDIRIDTSTIYSDGNKVQMLCSSGYFDLYFEPGCGMENTSNPTHNARRAVICQLFTDLSAFITNKGGISNKVRIFIRDMNKALSTPTASSSGLGAAATSYYSYPYAPAKSGIIDGEIWKTINSGQDSYIGIASPLILSGTAFYHGQLFFNFYNTAFSWHDNLSNNPPGNTLDLYTIGLHEATHALGFSSGINFNGNSVITFGSNYYTRYDLKLKSQGGLNLITNSGGCSMYSYSINPSFTNPTNTLSPGSATCSALPTTINSDLTTCSTSLIYSNASQNVNVYTPDCFESGSSLSHFEDMCYPTNTPTNNNQYFVMSNQTGNGQMKRYLKEEERKVLCDIGYSVAATYGTPTYTTTQKTYTSGACSGLGVAGINDGLGTGGTYLFVTTVNTAITGITPLTNDVGTSGGSFECLEVVIGTGTVSNTSGTAFTYTPTTSGLHLLRYVPKNSSGTVRGNITYIYVKVNPASGSCSLPNNCEMVYNGGFENSTPTCGQNSSFYAPALGPFINCWDLISGYFDLYIRNCNTPSAVNGSSPANWSIPTGGVETWNGAPNNSFIKLNYSSTLNRSVFQTALTTSLVPTSQYKLSFWAYVSTGTSLPTLTLSVASSTAPVAGPILPSISLPSPYTSLSTFTVPPDGNWHHCSAIFNFSGTSAAKYISLIPLYNSFSVAANFLIDDISIIPSSAISTFSLPASSCTGTSYTLNPLVSIPNGTFTGPGVSLIGSDYVFNPTTAGIGIKTISYTYTTVTGCTLTAYAQTQVYNTPTLSISQYPSSGLCPGYSTSTITASGATNYTLTDGTNTYTTNPTAVSPLSTTNYTVIGANSICTDTKTLAVNVSTACVCVGQYTLGSVLTNTTISPSTSTYTTYAINSNLSISGAVSFYGSEFLIKSGVTITVPSGATLTINRSHLYSCFDMWQGIVVQPGGSLVTLTDAFIEDAVTAVDVQANNTSTTSILDINQTIFNKNYTAISVSSYTANATTYPFNIRNTVFTSRTFTYTPTLWQSVSALKTACTTTSSVISPYCLQNAPLSSLKAPNNSTSSFVGINLNFVGRTQNAAGTPTYNCITIGDYITTSNFNVFDDLYYGIKAIDANIKCYNSVFQNMQWYFDFWSGNFIGGIGISHLTSTLEPNTNLNLTPPSPYYNTRKNKFYDCSMGVYVGNIFEVSANYMEFRSQQTSSSLYQAGKYGVYCSTDRFRQYDVNNNQFYNIENGIVFNSTYGPVKLSGTTFTNTQYAGNVNLNYNTFKPTLSGAYGSAFISNAVTAQNILSAGSTQTVLSGATIKASGNIITDAYRGVYATNFSTPPLQSSGNAITLLPDPGANNQYGVKLTSTSNATVATNNVTGASSLASNTLVTGIYASLNNTISVICNTVSTIGQGFEFAQYQPGTVWRGNSMTNHKYGYALTYTGNIGAQGSSGNPIDNTWNGTWTFLTNYHTWTDNGTFASTSPLFTRSVTPYLPLYNDGNPTFQSYAVCCTNTTTGSYSCGGGGGSGSSMVMSSSTNTSTLSTTTSILESTSQDVSNYIAQNQLYRYLNDNPNVKTSSSQLQSFYNTAKASNIGKLYDAEIALATGNYAMANSLISTINPVNTTEGNYKDFYILYSKFYNGSWLVSDNAQLLAICNKCPLTEGSVVYQARALYNVVNRCVQTFIDNCPIENSNARFSNTNSSSSVNEWTANIYPNPTSEELFINSSNEQEELQVRITDVSGKLIATYNVRTTSFIAQVKLYMKSGVYFVILTNNENKSIVKKLVVTK